MVRVVAILLFTISSCKIFQEEGAGNYQPYLNYQKKNLTEWLEKNTGNPSIPSIAVRVIHGDKVVYEKLVSTDIHKTYGIASISKTFTAAAVMKLIEDGRLRLDDPLVKYLPDADLANPSLDSSPVSIRNLLSHTSGIPDLRYYKTPEFVDVAAGRNRFKIPRQIYPAGLHYRYSNHGYLLLGALVEETSGISLDSYLYQNIFQPLEMDDAETIYLSGAGGIKLSIEDFTHYAMMWLNSGTYKNTLFLRRDFTGLMVADGIESGRFCGLGWRVDNSEYLNFFHIGGADGMAAWIQIFPEMDVAVIYLADPPVISDKVMNFITLLQAKLYKMAVATGDPVLKPGSRKRKDSPDLAVLEGEYTSPVTNEKIQIRLEDKEIFYRSAAKNTRLYRDTGYTYRSVSDSLTYEFFRDDGHHPAALANPDGYYIKTAD